MYYFAYGSNMDAQQMRHRCPSSRFICVARLRDYRFAIARHSRLRNCGTANIFVEKGAEVWGVVFDLSDQDFTTLDGFEDGYRREQVLVHDRNQGGHPIDVVTYTAPREDHVPLPNADYKRLILAGARHWQLPESYCAVLEQIEAARHETP